MSSYEDRSTAVGAGFASTPAPHCRGLGLNGLMAHRPMIQSPCVATIRTHTTVKWVGGDGRPGL